MSDHVTKTSPESPLLSGKVSSAAFTQACEARRELMQRVSTVCAASVARITEEILCSLSSGGTILLVGNGGSAAECQHFAAELVVRFRVNRRALRALSLTTDTSTLTASGNDFSFNDCFSRQIEALGRPGDGLVLLSTSGRSENILRAAITARSMCIKTLGLLGRDGGSILPLCDEAVVVPTEDTAMIQEVHLMVIHLICGAIDDATAGG